MRRAHAGVVVAIALCGVAGVALLSRVDDAGGDRTDEPGRVGRRVVPRRPPAADRVTMPRVAASSGGTDAAVASVPPASLRDTEVDGGLTVDPQGRFVVNPETRLFFDYYLAASGEEPLAVLRARLVAAIQTRLPAGAAVTAVALLDRYLHYRDQARALEERGGAATDIAERFAQIWALRRQTFGAADAEALFGPEEARDRIEAERRQVLGDRTLAAAVREARLADLDAALPETARAARAAATLPQRLRRDEAALRAAGGSDEEIQALREQVVGTDAAARLAALDAERARWRQRVEDYRRARAAIERDPALTPEQRAGAAAALVGERFTEPEQARVAALERLAALPTPVLPGLTSGAVLDSEVDPRNIDEKEVR